MKTFSVMAGTIGFFLLLFSNVIGVGTFLYLWGAAYVALGLAAWTAFKYWLGFCVIGLSSILVGIFAG